MIAAKSASGELPDINADDDVYVYLSSNHFQQDILQNFNNSIINIYCVYKLDPISSSRDNTFTVQNAVFGAMQITKNADTSRDMVFVLIKVVCLALVILTMVEMFKFLVCIKVL